MYYIQHTYVKFIYTFCFSLHRAKRFCCHPKMETATTNELNDDGTSDTLLSLYKKMSDDTFVDNEREAKLVIRSRGSNAESEDRTLFESIGVDPVTCQ